MPAPLLPPPPALVVLLLPTDADVLNSQVSSPVSMSGGGEGSWGVQIHAAKGFSGDDVVEVAPHARWWREDVMMLV
jgi:hypothetical protein